MDTSHPRRLAVDLGTTWTAAWVSDGDRTEPVVLGGDHPSMPSVVAHDGDRFVVGDAAVELMGRRPDAGAREVKRRFGDTTPIVVDGRPFGADALMVEMLRHVASTAFPDGWGDVQVMLTHPANWGQYKLELLHNVGEQAGFGQVSMLPEPVAAALHFVASGRLERGAVAAVYDFGGGTFDAAVVRVDDAPAVLGQPSGLERLGGIDLDQLIFTHVTSALGESLRGLDSTDPAVRAGIAQLRTSVTAAKETLSTESDVSIPVALPGLHTEVRLTRAEFESMLAQRVDETLSALDRAVVSSGVPMDQVAGIVLVGGSAQIPMVAERVRTHTERPTLFAADPKSVVAGGALLGMVEAAAVAEAARDAAEAGDAGVPPEVASRGAVGGAAAGTGAGDSGGTGTVTDLAPTAGPKVSAAATLGRPSAPPPPREVASPTVVKVAVGAMATAAAVTAAIVFHEQVASAVGLGGGSGDAAPSDGADPDAVAALRTAVQDADDDLDDVDGGDGSAGAATGDGADDGADAATTADTAVTAVTTDASSGSTLDPSAGVTDPAVTADAADATTTATADAADAAAPLDPAVAPDLPGTTTPVADATAAATAPAPPPAPAPSVDRPTFERPAPAMHADDGPAERSAPRAPQHHATAPAPAPDDDGMDAFDESPVPAAAPVESVDVVEVAPPSDAPDAPVTTDAPDDTSFADAKAVLLERVTSFEPPVGATEAEAQALRAELTGMIDRYEPRPDQSTEEALAGLRDEFDERIQDFTQDQKIDALIQEQLRDREARDDRDAATDATALATDATGTDDAAAAATVATTNGTGDDATSTDEATDTTTTSTTDATATEPATTGAVATDATTDTTATDATATEPATTGATATDSPSTTTTTTSTSTGAATDAPATAAAAPETGTSADASEHAATAEPAASAEPAAVGPVEIVDDPVTGDPVLREAVITEPSDAFVAPNGNTGIVGNRAEIAQALAEDSNLTNATAATTAPIVDVFDEVAAAPATEMATSAGNVEVEIGPATIEPTPTIEVEIGPATIEPTPTIEVEIGPATIEDPSAITPGAAAEGPAESPVDAGPFAGAAAEGPAESPVDAGPFAGAAAEGPAEAPVDAGPFAGAAAEGPAAVGVAGAAGSTSPLPDLLGTRVDIAEHLLLDNPAVPDPAAPVQVLAENAPAIIDAAPAIVDATAEAIENTPVVAPLPDPSPALDELPDLPDLPDMPDVPDLPEMPALPDVPDLPDLPDIGFAEDIAGDITPNDPSSLEF